MERWTHNLGNAVGISLISCRRAEIQRLLSRFLGNFTISGFCGRHIGILDDDGQLDMPGLCHLIAKTFLGKVIKGYLSTTCGSEMAAKRSAWGGVI